MYAASLMQHGLEACRLRQLQLMSSVAAAHGLSCLVACGIFSDQG